MKLISTFSSTALLYPIIQRLNEQLSRAYDDCGSTDKHARLGGAGNDCGNWLEDYDKGERGATYLAGFNAICEALEAFAECGYAVDTSEIWVNSHAE